MHFLRNACLTGVLLFLIFSQTSAQQNETTAAEWYQNFFTQDNKLPVDKLKKRVEDQLLELNEVRDDSTKVLVLLEYGLIHLTRTFEYDSAMDFFIQALAIADTLENPSGRIFSYLAIADLFEAVGNYDKSLQFLQRAFELSGNLGNEDIHILVLNELGKINTAIGRADDALQNFEDVLKLEEQLNRPGMKADALFNLADLHDKFGEYEKSITYHKRALAIWRSVGNRLQEGRLLNEIGGVYERMKNPERALANYTAALEVYQIIDQKTGIAESYNNLGAFYYQQKKIEEAIKNLELGLSAGRSSQTKDPVRKSYDLLSVCFEAQGNFQQALTYKNLYVAMNDFIQKEESDQKLLEAQSRYMLDQKETQIEKLESVRKQREREIAEQRKVRNFLFALIGLSIVVAGLILYMYLLKRRSNKQLKVINARVEDQNIQLQNLNATKDKFFSILGHDLKSPLNSLSSFSSLLINYFDSLSKEEIQTLAKDLDKSLKNLYSLLDNLLEWARSQTGNINFKPELFDLTTVLNENKELLNVQAGNKEISLIQEQTSPLTVSTHKHSITTVVRNLISNAIKFTPAGGQIKIVVSETSTEVIVSVADTGVGMSESVIKNLFRIDSKHSTLGTANEKGTGLGLVLCKDFVEKNGGRLWVESKEGAGSVFYFSIPKLQQS